MKLLFSTAPLFPLALFIGCNSAPAAEEHDNSPFDDGFIRLSELEDKNPEDDVVEVSLVASVSPLEIIEGVSHDQFTYNGSVPGPLIRAQRGDTLVVHLKNELPQGTTIHWHGIRVPNGMDGVPGMTQEVVEPGEEFRYEFELLDASTFWYHPHFQTLEQVGNGLYGAVLVEDPDEEPALGKETVLAISDLSVFEDGTIQEHPHTDERRAAGREGATLLVNGHQNQRMRVKSGERLRFRVLNMARSRYLELKLDGHEFLRIGSDGGRMEAPILEATTSLVPGERVDIIFEPTGEPGTHLDLVTLPVDRGPGASTAEGPELLVRFEFVEGPSPSQVELPSLRRELELFSTSNAEEVDITLTMGAADGKLVMGINHVPWSESDPFQAIFGQPQIWNIINASAYAHPFHLHGFYFQVLDSDGNLEWPLSYKDTINVEPLQTLRLVPRFDEDRLGMWMFHCHILDHAESGMMGVLHLSDGSELPE